MRKVLSAFVVVASSFALLHCAGSPSSTSESPGPSKDDNVTEQHQSDAGAKPDTAAPPAYDAAPPPRPDAGPQDAAADRAVDAAPKPPPPPPPPLACTELASCCVELTSSTQGAACLATVGYGQLFSSQYAQIAACAAGYAAYDCANAGVQTDLGPSCAQLVACCNSSDYGPYIGSDPACQDWKQQNESICDSDLAYYQSDSYGDCL